MNRRLCLSNNYLNPTPSYLVDVILLLIPDLAAIIWLTRTRANERAPQLYSSGVVSVYLP